MHLIGSRSNPYPIIAAADLVAVTSKSESFCNVIAEAEILGKPVISTTFDAAYEAVKNKKVSVICDIDDFSKNISNIIENYEKHKMEKDYNLKEFYYLEKERFAKKIGDILCQ